MKPDRYRAFGPFVLDTLRGRLWHDGTPVALTPRVAALLSTFVESPGELLSKDDLMRRVWAGVIVEENNLARHISTIRKILGERPEEREYIATVPGVGYRFVASVTTLEELPAVCRAPVAAPRRDLSSPIVSDQAAAPPVPAQVPGLTIDRRRVGWRAAVAATVLVAGAAAGWWFVWRDSGGAPPAERTFRQLTYEGGLQQDPVWSPDGTRIAYASDRLGNADIWIQAVAEATPPVRVTSSAANDWQPAWSPDGRFIAFRSERDGGGLFVVAADGGAERRLTDFGTHPRWSPSGDLILFSRAGAETAGATRLCLIRPDGTGLASVASPALSRLTVVNAAWHPDGRLSVLGRDQANAWALATFRPGGAPVTRSDIPAAVQEQLASSGVSLLQFVWAPTGRFLFLEGRSEAVRNLWRVAVRPRTLAWTGALEQLTTGPGRNAGLSLSPDGRQLAFSVSTPRLSFWSYAFDAASGRIVDAGQDVTPGQADEQDMDASADGRRLVYRSLRSDRFELWERSSVAEDPRLLAATTEWRYSLPRWSPDGTRVAYQRTRSGGGSRAERVISILAVDNREERLLDVPVDTTMVPGDWQADGRALLGGCRLPAQPAMGTCVMPVDGGEARQLAYDPRADLVQHRFSPDQRWISFAAIPLNDRSVSTVYVMPARSGASWTPLTDGQSYDDKPRWAPDGRTLYFVSNRGGRPDVWGRRFDPETGEPESGVFRVTSFDRGPRILPTFLRQLGMVISTNHLFLPMYEATGHLWVLDGVDR
ncbi:MAG: PD40 domain-containing protein [Acidobacteria bacterium]|nr:PD40 domain-containing protein [Acidobacteriota bacterium]